MPRAATGVYCSFILFVSYFAKAFERCSFLLCWRRCYLLARPLSTLLLTSEQRLPWIAWAIDGHMVASRVSRCDQGDASAGGSGGRAWHVHSVMSHTLRVAAQVDTETAARVPRLQKLVFGCTLLFGLFLRSVGSIASVTRDAIFENFAFLSSIRECDLTCMILKCLSAWPPTSAVPLGRMGRKRRMTKRRGMRLTEAEGETVGVGRSGSKCTCVVCFFFGPTVKRIAAYHDSFISRTPSPSGTAMPAYTDARHS